MVIFLFLKQQTMPPKALMSYLMKNTKKKSRQLHLKKMKNTNFEENIIFKEQKQINLCSMKIMNKDYKNIYQET